MATKKKTSEDSEAPSGFRAKVKVSIDGKLFDAGQAITGVSAERLEQLNGRLVEPDKSTVD